MGVGNGRLWLRGLVQTIHLRKENATPLLPLHTSVLTPHKVAPLRELDQRSSRHRVLLHVDERCESIQLKAFMSLLQNKITVHLTDGAQFHLVMRQISLSPKDLGGKKGHFYGASNPETPDL